jgi:hypothetical protein
MRNRRHILNLSDLDAQIIERTNSRFATGAWALDAYFQILHTAFDGNFARSFGSNLSCERRGLT